MIETAVTFGPAEGLVGILTEPLSSRPRSPVVVMWNVGINHRVGPARTWVALARRLAAHGMTSFRFDLSGLGDSAPRPDLVDDIERAVLDLQAALDWLSTRSARPFVLVSNCSGTDNAHYVAVRDPRVAGAVFLDGYSYETSLYRAQRGPLRWVSPVRWRRVLRRRFPRAFGLELDSRAAGATDEIFQREYPPREQFEADMTTMVARGVHLLFIYSGETGYGYRRQFWDWLERKDWSGRITVEFYPKANHTYTFRAEREVMLARVTQWLRSLGV
jgi:hypothetical protein